MFWCPTMNNLNTLFLPCTVDGYAPTAASFRFRCQWPAKYWDEADVYPNMRLPWDDYDAYIFQKAYLTEKAKSSMPHLVAAGKVLAFDLCDADWLLSPVHERHLLGVLPFFTFAVAPTEPIRAWLAKWLPAYVIRDRLDLSEFEVEVDCVIGEKPSLVWYGYAHNIHAIESMWPIIEERGLSVTILSNELPEPWASRPRVQFVEWQQETANSQIAMHEFALCPPASLYKSDNREITAQALGVIPVKTPQQLDGIARLGVHQREVLVYALGNYSDDVDVRQSVAEWKTLIHKFYDKLKGST